MVSWDIWGNALSFLFASAIRDMDLGPVQLAADEPRVTVENAMHTNKMLVTLQFWIEMK